MCGVGVEEVFGGVDGGDSNEMSLLNVVSFSLFLSPHTPSHSLYLSCSLPLFLNIIFSTPVDREHDA